MTQLPTTIPELRKLIEDAQAEIERLQGRAMPPEAVSVFRDHLGVWTNVLDSEIVNGLRAVYPIMRAAWETSQPEDDGWIPWNGARFSPVIYGVKVDCRYRSGDTHKRLLAGLLRWDHNSGPDDIVAYRIVKGDGQ